MNGQSIRFGVKVAIALIVVLTIAGMLYYLQHLNKIKGETDIDEHLTAQAISNPVTSENKVESPPKTHFCVTEANSMGSRCGTRNSPRGIRRFPNLGMGYFG